MVNSTFLRGVTANILCILLCGYSSEVIYRGHCVFITTAEKGAFLKQRKSFNDMFVIYHVDRKYLSEK